MRHEMDIFKKLNYILDKKQKLNIGDLYWRFAGDFECISNASSCVGYYRPSIYSE